MHFIIIGIQREVYNLDLIRPTIIIIDIINILTVVHNIHDRDS